MIYNDNIVIEMFSKNGKLLRNRFNNYNIDNDIELKTFLEQRYNDSKTLYETLFRIKYKIDKRPTCKTCGGEVHFIGKPSKPYADFCCRSCLSKHNINIIKEKYGVPCTLLLQETHKKALATLQKHYGDNIKHNWESPEIRKNCVITTKNKYGDDVYKNQIPTKAKQTCKKLYNNENYRNIDAAKNTYIKKYGVNHPLQGFTSKQHSVLQEKRLKTLREHNTWNKSKIETLLYDYFEKNNYNFKYQYKSNVYPYTCDFYLIDFDLYIEIQGCWTHGFHPFNKFNEDDLNKLKYWQSKKSKFYDNAIKTWTIFDVNKRHVAEINKLNYLEIFSIKLDTCITEIQKYIKNLNL